MAVNVKEFQKYYREFFPSPYARNMRQSSETIKKYLENLNFKE